MLGNVKMVKCLSDSGASIFITDGVSTLLRYLVTKERVSKKDYEIIDMILTEHNINQVDNLGHAAIHYAMQSSCFETLQKIITKGGNIQLRTAIGVSVWDILLNISDKKDVFFSNIN
ncbi:MAG: hypothetical protein Q8R24_00715 [Legionellaceae bacterium]|nr:hypothetical protein [Legionellaceae bacterium]